MEKVSNSASWGKGGFQDLTENRRLAQHNAASIGLRKHNDNGVPQPRGLRRLNVST